MNAKLSKEDIKGMDIWLKKKGIKYLDIRYELLDHLASEYEQLDDYPDLESFLRSKLSWCRKIDKQKQKTVNFSTTKALFKSILSHFTKINSLVILIVFALVLFYGQSVIAPKLLKNLLLGLAFLPIIFQLYLMVFSGFGPKLKKESVSAVYLINIFTLPQLPLYFVGIFPETWIETPNFYIPFLALVFLLNISAILFFFEKRNQLLKQLVRIEKTLT